MVYWIKSFPFLMLLLTTKRKLIKLPEEVFKDLNATYVGHDANSKKHVLSVKRPVEHTIVTNWDDMEVLWRHMFEKELAIRADKHLVLMTEPPMNPKANREKMTQIMFEMFEVPGFYLASTAELSLFASGRRTGFVLESGEGGTFPVPFYEGHRMPHAVPKIEICGRDLDYYMMKLLHASHARTLTFNDLLPMARDIKESMCYVAKNYDQESERASCYIEKTYTRTNGDTLAIAKERFQCPEALFKPDLCDNRDFGIHQGVYTSIMKCDAEIRPELFSNIVISGGSTLLPGLSERLETEVKSLAPPGTGVNVIVPPDRDIAAWVGGSKLASSAQFKRMVMTFDEYDEFGPGLVHRKCF